MAHSFTGNAATDHLIQLDLCEGKGGEGEGGEGEGGVWGGGGGIVTTQYITNRYLCEAAFDFAESNLTKGGSFVCKVRL
jgi:23S rRNA U2552 (ribose-2'-O)-methylase RlmE/FtsJ